MTLLLSDDKQPGPTTSMPIPPPSLTTYFILGVRFHALTLAQAVQQIDSFIADRVPRQICLSNAYTVILCRKDAVLRSISNRCALTLADGMSVVWGGQWTGARLPERVAGPDLMRALCDLSRTKGYKIFLLGSDRENLDRLGKSLERTCPGVNIVGQYSPPFCDQFGETENQKIFTRLDETKPDIVFVGLSAPKQEKWIDANLSRLHAPIFIGVGAAFDFLSGKVPRAPLPIQRMGLEWLYRLWCEPRRLWKRYLLGNSIFIVGLLKTVVANKFKRQIPADH